jgi:hypothetical protein
VDGRYQTTPEIEDDLPAQLNPMLAPANVR